MGLYGAGWRTQPLSAEAQALYAAAIAEIKTPGAILVEDPFLGTDFSNLASGEEFDLRGMESMPHDVENFLRRMGSSAKATSLAGLAALLEVNPFSPEGPLGTHLVQPILKKSLENPALPPDLSEFLAARVAYLKTFNSVMAQHKLDVLIFPQMSAQIPGIFGEDYPATTVSEINIAGLPGVTIPAGKFANGAPFALILVGAMWSEAELLDLAYDYEQSSAHRIVPVLEETVYAGALTEGQ